MFTKISRFLSAFTPPTSFQYTLEILPSTNPQASQLERLIKQYKAAYHKAQKENPSYYWTIDKKILNSLTSLTPHLQSLDPVLINELIVTLSNFSIASHSIWPVLEVLFLEKSIKVLELKDVPHFLIGFSLKPCTSQFLWRVLVQKMQKFVDECEKDAKIMAEAYTALIKVSQGTPELKTAMKDFLVLNMDEVNCPLLIKLLVSLQEKKIDDPQFIQIIISKVLQNLDQCEVDDLTQLHTEFFISKLDYSLTQVVEKRILEVLPSMQLRNIAACIVNYLSPNIKKREKFSDFPFLLFTHYLGNRNQLALIITNKQTLAVYDTKILGTGLALGYTAPAFFVKAVFKSIEKSSLNLEMQVHLKAKFLYIQNYIKSNS